MSYSNEQRQIAVKYYLEHNRSLTQTIEALGYPSKSRLRRWVLEDVPEIKSKSLYTLEQRQKAVQYYIEHGNSIRETVEALGYPSPVQLRSWVLEYSPEKYQESKYTEEERNVAIKYYLEHGKSIKATIEALKYPSESYLYKWVRDLQPRKRKILKTKYTPEQRKNVVQYYLEHGNSITETIRFFGYPSPAALRSWIMEEDSDAHLKSSYSVAERKAAVKYFLEHGKSIQVTIAALKYPSEKQLYNWIRKYAPNVKPTSYSKYTAEERDVAVQYFLEHGNSIPKTIKGLGYPSPPVLRRWLSQDMPEIKIDRFYTVQEREKAVKYFLENGRSIRGTIKVLKYPSENQLRRWVRSDAPGIKAGYTDEERMTAVRYFLEHGHSVKRTLDVLQYPCEDQLRKWIREDAPEVEFQKTPNYTEAQRQDVVRYFLEHGKDVDATIDAFGYPSKSILYSWIKKYSPGAITPLYTDEERLKAVYHFVYESNSTGITVKKLNYPSKPSLRRWIKKYAPSAKLKSWKKYTEDQIAIAIQEYLNSRNVLDTVEMLRFPSPSALYKWIRIHAPETRECLRVSSPFEPRKDYVNAVDTVLTKNLPDIITKPKTKSSKERKVECFMKTHKTPIPPTQRIQQEETKADERDVRISSSKKSNNAYAVPSSPDNESPNLESQSLHCEIESLHQEIKDLKNTIRKLQIEKEALEIASNILKKDEGVSLELLTNREKTLVIDTLKKKYALKELLSCLNLSKSSYFYQESALKAPDKYLHLRETIKQIFHSNYESYGYRRMHVALKQLGITISEKIIIRIMQEEKLIVHTTKRKGYSSYLGEITPEVPNIVDRNFHADAPNKVWLTDITEFSIPKGKVYLSSIIDCFDGLPVAWAMHTSPNENLANTTLLQAISTLKPWEHPIIHSDRGCHYRWPSWIKITEQAQLVRSMSKKGCSPDNAACEGHFGSVKNEMFYNRSWNDINVSEFINILDEYMHWFSEKRIKMSLGGMSPLEYRQKLGLVG